MCLYINTYIYIHIYLIYIERVSERVKEKDKEREYIGCDICPWIILCYRCVNWGRSASWSEATTVQKCYYYEILVILYYAWHSQTRGNEGSSSSSSVIILSVEQPQGRGGRSSGVLCWGNRANHVTPRRAAAELQQPMMRGTATPLLFEHS